MVSEIDHEVNKLFHSLVVQGKSYEEIQSILDSVYTLVGRIENEEIDCRFGLPDDDVMQLYKL